MSKIFLDVIVVLVIGCIGGFFSASEMALVSLREGQVRALAKRGPRPADRAAGRDPTRFFSAVRSTCPWPTWFRRLIAAALAGFLSRGWSASTCRRAGRRRCCCRGDPHHARSLVLGESAPKRIALQRAPRLALLAAPLLDRIASLARPVVWLLTVTTNVVIPVLGGDPRLGRQAMTQQELCDLVIGAGASQDERHIVAKCSTPGNGRSARCWCRAPRWSSWTRRRRCPRPPRSPPGCRIRGCRCSRTATTT